MAVKYTASPPAATYADHSDEGVSARFMNTQMRLTMTIKSSALSDSIPRQALSFTFRDG